MDNKRMTAIEIDAIGEILNISLGASATAVSTMLDARVDITTPVVQVKMKDEFEFSNLEPAVGVEIVYIEGLSGSNIMLLKRNDVKIIVEMLMGMEFADDEFELDEMNISAICEVMNQMMGASSTALSEFLSKTVNISTPVSFEVENTEQFKDKYFEDEGVMVVIGFTLKIADRMESEFINLMPVELAKELVSGFFPQGTGDEMEEPEPEEAAVEQPAPVQEEPVLQTTEQELAPPPEQPAVESEQPASMPEQPVPPAQPAPTSMPEQPVAAQEPAAAMPQQPAPAAMPQQPAPVSGVPETPNLTTPAAQPVGQGAVPQGASSVDASMMQQMMDMMRQQLELQQMQLQQIQTKAPPDPKMLKVNSMPQPNLTPEGTAIDPDANLDLIMGVPLEVSVEIGRTKKLVKDILELNKGALVVLDKLAGEQVDVFANGQCIARGDVVVVEDSFGVRITEILQTEIEVEQ